MVFVTLCASPAVNYRGSTGFGQDSILSLIGHIGSQDVKDVQVPAGVRLSLSTRVLPPTVIRWERFSPAASCDRGAEVGRHPGLRALGCDWRLSRRIPVVPSRRPVPRGVPSLRCEEPRGQRRHPAGDQRHSGLVRLDRIAFSSPTLLRGVHSCDLRSTGGTPA